MKPPRGKREGLSVVPALSGVAARGRREFGCPSGCRLTSDECSVAALAPGEGRDRPVGRPKSGAHGNPLRRVVQAHRKGRCSTAEVRAVPPGAACRHACGASGTALSARGRAVCRCVRPPRNERSAASSATFPTRLETRTKESNARASRGAVRNPKAQ